MTDGKRDQIRRQRVCRREPDDLLRRIDIGFGNDRRIRNGDQVAGHAQRQFPRHLESRLVEAGKCLPRGHGLEVRHRVRRTAVLQREDAARRVAVLHCAIDEIQPVAARG